MDENCLTCKHFIACANIRKGRRYICGEYAQKVISEDVFSQNADWYEQHSTPSSMTDEEAEDRELELVGYVDELFDTPVGSNEASRITVDDRDLKEFPNFVEFATSSRGLDSKPFIKQMAIATSLYAEWCPACSKRKLYNLNKVPKGKGGDDWDEDLEKFLHNITLLNHGVCPKCKATKSSLIRDGKLFLYNEMNILAGQRCVEGSTTVFTQNGLFEIEELSKDRPFGFSPFHESVHDGKELNVASAFYCAKPELLRRITTKHGFSLRGTDEHPVMTLGVFKTLKEVTRENFVEVRYNYQTYGSGVVRLLDVSDSTNTRLAGLTVKKRPRRKPGRNHKNIYMGSDLARFLGFYVSEGSYRGISNKDTHVLNHCERVLSDLFGKRLVKRGVDYVEWRGQYVAHWLSTLIGGEVLKLRSATQSVPLCIRTAPKVIQQEFLKALFEGDGSAYGNCVEYSTISKRLMQHLSAMLLNMGVIHQIYKVKTWAKNGSANQVSKNGFKILIEGPVALKQFQIEIGFLSERKNKTLNDILEGYKKRHKTLRSSFWYEKLPDSVKHELTYFLDALKQRLNGIRNRETGKVFGLQTIFGIKNMEGFIGRMYSHNVALNKRKLTRILSMLRRYDYLLSVEEKSRLLYFDYFTQADVYWDAIVSIKVGKTPDRTYDFHIPNTHRFVSNGILSHNSGKSATIALLAPYAFHKYLKMDNKNLQRLLGMKHAILVGTFAGLTFAKAVELLWTPITNAVSDSPWFQDMHNLLQHYGDKHGVELVRFKETFLDYNHKNLHIYASGPNKRTLRGSTRIISAVDELGWFNNSEGSDEMERASADEVYVALDRSLKTVRTKIKRMILEKNQYNLIQAYSMNISSPSSHRDKITTLVRENEGSKTKLVGRFPTWEFNPEFSKEDFAEDFAADPIKAARDFGANPPLNANPFIFDRSFLDSILHKKNLVEYEYKYHTSTSGMIQKYAVVTKMHQPFGDKVPASVLTLDAGHSDNSFAMALGCVTKDFKGVVTPRIYGLIEVAPDRGNNQVNFARLYEDVIKKVIPFYNVKLLVADRWQSKMLLSQAEKDFPGLSQEEYSIDYNQFMIQKTYLQADNCAMRMPTIQMEPDAIITQGNGANYPHCFQYKPADHLYFQYLTVQDTGKSVEKGLRLTDDLFRAVSLNYAFLLDEEDWQRKLLNQSKARGGINGPMAVVAGKTELAGVMGHMQRQLRNQVVAQEAQLTSRAVAVSAAKTSGSPIQNGGLVMPYASRSK